LKNIDDTELRELIQKSWEGIVTFKAEIRLPNGQIVQPGLRPSQIGALHAVAAHWSVTNKPAFVVMPTSTGKTEVMLACWSCKGPIGYALKVLQQGT
jgi:superfamily II DNA or RNA helicase